MIVLLEDVINTANMNKISNTKSILRHLIDSPRWISIDELIDVLYADREDGGPMYCRDNVVYIIFCLRKRLKPGLSIEASGSGFYRLVVTPEKLEEILLKGVAETLAAKGNAGRAKGSPYSVR